MWDGDCWLEKEQASKGEVWLGKRVEVERVMVWLRKNEDVRLEERMGVEVQWGRNDLLGKGYLDSGHLWYQREEFGLKEALEGYWPMNTNCFRMFSSAPGTKFDWNKKDCNQLVNYYSNTAAAAAKSLQLCPTLCDPIDGSPPGSPVPGILQARTL